MGFSVDFSTVHGYPQPRTTDDGQQAVTQLMCAWDDMYTLMDELWDAGNNKFPYNNNWYAYVWDVRGKAFPGSRIADLSGDTKLASYDDAILTVIYSSNAVALNSTGVVGETFKPTEHWYSLGYMDLDWKTGGVNTRLRPDESTAVMCAMPKAMYFREEKGVTSIPAGCNAYIGYTNNTIVPTAILGISFAVGALQYKGTTLRRQLNSSGATRFRLIHQCEFNPQGWNNYPRKETGAFEKVYSHKSGNQIVLPSANINTCFST